MPATAGKRPTNGPWTGQEWTPLSTARRSRAGRGSSHAAVIAWTTPTTAGTVCMPRPPPLGTCNAHPGPCPGTGRPVRTAHGGQPWRSAGCLTSPGEANAGSGRVGLHTSALGAGRVPIQPRSAAETEPGRDHAPPHRHPGAKPPADRAATVVVDRWTMQASGPDCDPCSQVLAIALWLCSVLHGCCFFMLYVQVFPGC